MQLPDIVLFQPEIPPNSGNIIRLCANTGAALHFIHPLGFSLDDRQLRRAGLDYAEYARIHEHASLDAYLAARTPRAVFALTARGRVPYTAAPVEPCDALLFGPETAGLPDAVVDRVAPARRLRVPMLPRSRSMNLANCVAVVTYEIWRQQDFAGGV